MNEFEEFKKYFKEYQDKFGLNGWQVYFKHEPLNGSFARVNCDKEAMVATVRLNSKLLKKHQEFNDVEKHAKHEAIHLLLARFSCEACYRYADKDELNTAEEELVNKLANLII
uniref:SprT-like domain-containing protein n=1 Tax=viral metagenome TaxID=1070528 RepID=A0A6M3L0R3_9ZZZZ